MCNNLYSLHFIADDYCMSTHIKQPLSVELPPVNNVSPTSVFRWLALGWGDLRQAGTPSLLHGVIVSAFSLVMAVIMLSNWVLLPGAFSGFLLIGPILATGLYALSRKIEQGGRSSFKDVIHAWRQGGRCLFVFGLILIISATAWVIFSELIFFFLIDVNVKQPLDFLRYVVSQDDTVFLLWTLLGGLGTALVFAISVVSIPLLVERDVNTRLAILTSVRAVGRNPITMLWWSMMILFITGLSFITLMLGFIVLYPLLGHASWHVYRDMIDASKLPLRPEIE